jgi:hypothetical protein
MSQTNPYYINWSPADHASPTAPFASAEANAWWNRMDFRNPREFVHRDHIIVACAKWRPDDFEFLLTDPSCASTWQGPPDAWLQVMEETRQFDAAIVAALETMLRDGADFPPHREESNRAVSSFILLCRANALREGELEQRVLEWAHKPLFLGQTREAVKTIVRHCPGDACRLVAEASEHSNGWGCEELYRVAVRDLNGPRGVILTRVLAQRYMFEKDYTAIAILINEAPVERGVEVRRMLAEGAVGRSQIASDPKESFCPAPTYWARIIQNSASVLGPLMRELLCGKMAAARAAAAEWLTREDKDAWALVATLLSSRNIDERIGGVVLLSALPDVESTGRLREFHAAEASKQVRAVIAKLLAARGQPIAELKAEPKKAPDEIFVIADFEAKLAAKPKSIKSPTAPWLDAALLPPLYSKEGEPISELARKWIFQRQAREGGSLHEEVAQLLPLLDRTRNAPFAHVLLDQWFESDMKAADRWALDVAGIVGDNSIITRLTEPIEHWCRLNRGSRAEWAVHAISLLGTQKALVKLDGLIQRYRNHRKYVGEAASNAIQTTADLLGISQDELAERIVPEFGFSSEGTRVFKTRAGDNVVKLQPDFKFVWSLPDSENQQSMPVCKLTAGQGEELKDLKKTLKEAVSRHTLRLENAMIGGRRWSIDVWRQRFENHPVFRILATRLIWGAYDESGGLLRTFRLYPNGLTADHSGALEEFAAPATAVGLVHRLDLEEKSASAWVAHLRRFKVKPLFKQVDRSVHALDPLHGNRKELRLVEELGITAGKLRADLLRCGWSLGSTGDGGWIQCMFRKFPARDIEVYLPVGELHATSSKDDNVVLGSAFFARGTKGKRAYRDRMDEAEAITFNEVPPVIYSEIMADLNSLTEK